jgi:tetratricopeptide (TPR) repeat protein
LFGYFQHDVSYFRCKDSISFADNLVSALAIKVIERRFIGVLNGGMKRGLYLVAAVLAFMLLQGCGVKKNTRAARFYHAFTTRYNIYYNGEVAYNEALKSLEQGYKENYTELIYLHPISTKEKDKATPGGPFDRTIEKSGKAIRLHSIQAKPPKKPGWRNNPRAVAFQAQEEYNPFLKNSWLIMGRANFYNADFLRAAATFSYIARHYRHDPSVYAEARIWQARSYTELGWFYEAEDILRRLNIDGIPPSQRSAYAYAQTAYHLALNDPEAAANHLPLAFSSQRSKLQRTRMRYLLAQLYARTEREQEAYKLFRKVAAANPPYELEFAARIRQTEVFSGGNYLRMIKMLERMAHSDKNKDFLDQVYYAAGNIYLNRQDTVTALGYYEQAVEKSTLNGMDKALAQIRAGDIYFTQRDYVRAQPHFSGALQGINKLYHDYERISRLSAVLDELAIHAEAVQLQDSLQNLARIPEEERLEVIDKIIEQVIKEEKEAEEQANKEAYLAEQAAVGSGIDRKGAEIQTAMGVTASDGSFYFYNPQVVAQGKIQFQRKWGRRALTDDWRRNKKTFTSSFEMASPATETSPTGDVSESLAPADSLSTGAVESSETDTVVTDPKIREYYLQQIPFTPEEVEASNLIIMDGLFNLACIYKDKLEDLSLAIEGFETLEQRFPENEYRLESYYSLFLLGLRLNDDSLALRYKNKLLETFPESDYAVAIADPDYINNIRMMGVVQDSLYQATYNSHIAGDIFTVRDNYRLVSEKYPLSELMPKFMFLDALTYVAEGDAEGFQVALKTLLDKYPGTDVSELAGEMLKGILRGRALVQGSIRGMVWNMRFGVGEDGSLSADDSARTFIEGRNFPHRLVMLFPTGSIDRNQLLYTVAAYNFTNFIIKEFDMSFEEVGPATLLHITGFYSLDEALQYDKMIFSSGGYAEALHRDIALFPISEDNYQTLMHGKTPDEYINFLEETYGDETADIVARWRLHIDQAELEAESASDEEGMQKSKGDAKEEETEERKRAITSTVDTVVIAIPDTVTVIIPDTVAVDTVIAVDTVTADTVNTTPAIPLSRKELLRRQKEEDAAILQAKNEQEKLQRKQRKTKMRQAARDRIARRKAQIALRKQKEKERKQKEKENRRRRK